MARLVNKILKCNKNVPCWKKVNAYNLIKGIKKVNFVCCKSTHTLVCLYKVIKKQ